MSCRHQSNFVPRAGVPPHSTKTKDHASRILLPPSHCSSPNHPSQEGQKEPAVALFLTDCEVSSCVLLLSLSGPRNMGCVSCAGHCIVSTSFICAFLAETKQGHLPGKETKAYMALSVGKLGLDPGLGSLPTLKFLLLTHCQPQKDRACLPPQASRLLAMEFPLDPGWDTEGSERATRRETDLRSWQFSSCAT